MTKVQMQIVGLCSKGGVDRLIQEDPDVCIEWRRACDPEEEENKFGVAVMYALGYHPYNTNDGLWCVEKCELDDRSWLEAWIEHYRQRIFEKLDQYGQKRQDDSR